MAAHSKTLMDFFQQPAAKRLKRVSSPPLNDGASSLSTISSEQKLRMEFNKALALSKRNLKLCSDKVSKSIAAGVGYVKLEELLVEDTWSEVLSEELQKPYAKNLCEFVESEICHGSVPIYPPQHLIFNALNTTPFDQVKAVIIGQDPYHGPGQAMGLSFSVPEGVRVPSSLANIYKELQQDLGCSIPSNGNLEKWAVQVIVASSSAGCSPAKCRSHWSVNYLSTAIGAVKWLGLNFTAARSIGGVCLEICKFSTLSFCFTVRQHQANSHSKKGWEQFTDAVIGAISQKKRGVVFLLWGNYAQAKSRLIDESKHYILKSAHPSGLSAHRGFFGCRHFSSTNQILEKMGMSPIDWQL
ncbi:hypothetical protein BUALT_Bualt17G0004000 [Buddleja alternifolia]|uniref:Uracil-DNA glycosylase n=1 Tax=Buddleja alternifolia TaxID=168488 RepID=A0AAV6WEG5_9LAMI|nr:hypothetical protein BUALT_Bualt17G0004000 [Buddleja alternifolia]